MDVWAGWPSYKMPEKWADIAAWEWKYADPQETADLMCARCRGPITGTDSPAVRAWTVVGREYRVHARCWPTAPQPLQDWTAAARFALEYLHPIAWEYWHQVIASGMRGGAHF